MGRHRLTSERLFSEDVRFIGRYGGLCHAEREVIPPVHHGWVELGDLWEPDRVPPWASQ